MACCSKRRACSVPGAFQQGRGEGQRGFRALILIYAVNMQSVSATARLGIVKRNARDRFHLETIQKPSWPEPASRSRR